MFSERVSVLDRVADSLGLVKTGEYLTVFMPANQRALVFRVLGRVNEGREVLEYGPLPLPAGTTLPTFEGGSASVPADGVLPGRAYTTTGITFPLTGAYDSGDMWYVPEDYRDRLFHVKTAVRPLFTRIDVQIPLGVTQGRFQKDRVVVGVDKDFGFSRGSIELVHLPKIRYGYRFGNDTNLDLKTHVTFTYAEYIIEIPKSPELIFDILVKRVQSHWVVLPVAIMDRAISRALIDTYGFEGFPLYRIDERDEAIRKYGELLREVKI